ncbi:hypothetical protein Pcinc_013353 [Petrolisthes cinctipes]|uniref:Uncharacterized protein n=1 Tax=Petrolisthes cinctipes TaxID=88211 RepID=A0AAE1FX63_PETCI|nr:hypothetical protein Pcinc_013353 [Petrolisthes cinctipes]
MVVQEVIVSADREVEKAYAQKEPGSAHLEESGYDVDSVLDHIAITPPSRHVHKGEGGEDDWRWLNQRTGTELKVEHKLLI